MKQKFSLLIILFIFCTFSFATAQKIKHAVIISANAEWKIVKAVYPNEKYQKSPWGEYFFKEMIIRQKKQKVLFFHEGWGKVAAAGATQYVIDTFKPQYLINLGTCGGFAGDIERFSTILVNKTIIYDIIEAMGDSKEAIEDYSTTLDLTWLGENYPSAVQKTLMVSADRDIIATEIPKLKENYQAIAGDWETGAIAYTCARNAQKLLILRGVSDLVHPQTGGEAYGKIEVFVSGTETVMKKLLNDLPLWLEKCK
jgi:adenosylhomocysteine nucleosidase